MQSIHSIFTTPLCCPNQPKCSPFTASLQRHFAFPNRHKIDHFSATLQRHSIDPNMHNAVHFSATLHRHFAVQNRQLHPHHRHLKTSIFNPYCTLHLTNQQQLSIHKTQTPTDNHAELRFLTALILNTSFKTRPMGGLAL